MHCARHAFRLGLLRCLPLSAFALGFAPPAGAQFQPWVVHGGKVTIQVYEQMYAAGLTLQGLEQTAPLPAGTPDGEQYIGFQIHEASDLVFLVGRDLDFVPYGVIGGAVRTLGGFTLSSPVTGRSVDFHDFAIHTLAVRNDGPGGQPDPDYFALSGADGESGDLQICSVKIQFLPEGESYASGDPGDHLQPLVRVMAWDLVITDALAQKLARPELAGLIIGYGLIEGEAFPYDGRWTYPPGQNPFTPYTGDQGSGDGGASPGDGTTDVKLGDLKDVKQVGHVGTFPTGRAGLSMDTTSCNVGDTQVPWLSPGGTLGALIQEDHPGIAMQLYRQLGDRFEQVGVSWIKHGFFSTNQSLCTPCQGGVSTLLGIDCSDTYGDGNNSDPKYLGPRSEWNAFTAEFTCLGSYFDKDVTPPIAPDDCIRSQIGTGLNAVDHRLEAFDADLANPGATYFYEAMYMVQLDADLDNNIGSRQCTMSWNGSSWSFSTPSSGNSLLPGPAINRYGELRTTAGFAPHDGNVILAVQTTDLGAGKWRYEYALFNWNLDRQIRQFSVPAGTLPTAFYFHDTDDLPDNDWVAVASAGNVTWTFPDVFPEGHKLGGPLEFGTLYNFGFTSKTPPGDRNAALATQIHAAGGDLLAVATRAPAELNLTATTLAPAPNVPFDLIAQGGTSAAMFAVIAAGGITLPQPILLGPVPFVGGQALLPLTIPPEVSGLDLLFFAGDVNTVPLQLLALTNAMTIEVQ